MKLTALFLLIGFIHLSARTTAQQRISINMKAAPLDKIFAEIEKRSGYTVFYNTDVLKTAGLVTIDMKDASIEDVLHQCLKGLPLEFTIQEKTIFVKKEVRRISIDQSAGPGDPPGVSGIVRSESGAALAGATVAIRKIKRQILTNAAGEFILKGVADGEYEMDVSFVGYQNYSRSINVENHEAHVEVSLKQSMDQLDETVVKGYYTTTNRLNTGDVTTVKGEDIAKQPVSDPMLALEGRVPGLFIQQSSGVPGSYNTIRIRGQNSIANGNNPLYIVDGVPYSATSPTSTYIGGGILGNPGSASYSGASPFNDLSPSDIESIEVLKDADATAIYGSRGANGVILITTKKGKAGSTKFDLNAFSGFGKTTRFLPLLSTPQYLEMRHEAFNNDGLSPDPTYDFDMTAWDTSRYTNWQKILIGKASQFSNLQGVISGGNSYTQFRISGAYGYQGVDFPGNYADQKAVVSFSLNHASLDQKLHVQLAANYIYDYSNLPISNPTGTITLAPDAPPLYDGNGNLNWQPVNGDASWTNPLSYTLQHANAKTDNLLANFMINYQLFPGLELKSSFGYGHLQNNQTQLTPANLYAPPYDNLPGDRMNLYAMNESRSWIIEPQIIYGRDILKGKFNFLLGGTFQQNTSNSNGFISSGFASDALLNDPAAAASTTLIGFSSTTYHYDAIFARIGYDWEEKYLLNITARRDGSSRFGPGKQFGNFGAIGGGWIFSREDFMKNASSFLSFGKLRASYGTTGNDQIADYQFLSTYTPFTPAYQTITGLTPTRLSNANFGWELVKKLEGGIELGFIKDRLLITANYFRNRTGNQLVGYKLPQLTGFSTVQANLPAIVQNTGVEFALSTVNVKSKQFTWRSSINFTLPRNKLVAYPNLATSTYAHTYVIGQPLSMSPKFHYLGINDTTGVFEYASTKGPTNQPSSPQDLMNVKPVTQQWYGGFENTISYKGFDLSFLFQFVKQTGYSYFNYTYYSAGQFNINQPIVVFGRWQKPGDKAAYGRFSTENGADPHGDQGISDYSITDASFIRLKNAALSYHLSKLWLKKVHFENARLYIQCQNLLTITKYLGLDPETQSGSLPPSRMITGGIQFTL